MKISRIGHLLLVRPLVELPDDVGADAWPPGELSDQPLDRIQVESKGRAVALCDATRFANVA